MVTYKIPQERFLSRPNSSLIRTIVSYTMYRSYLILKTQNNSLNQFILFFYIILYSPNQFRALNHAYLLSFDITILYKKICPLLKWRGPQRVSFCPKTHWLRYIHYAENLRDTSNAPYCDKTLNITTDLSVFFSYVQWGNP